MIDKTYMYLYTMKSKGGLALKKKLGVQQIKHKDSLFKGEKNKIVINWGAGYPPAEVLKCTVINKPDAICNSVNKINFFRLASKKTRTVPHTFSQKEAQQWVNTGGTVYCRTQVEGFEGKGIEIIKGKDLPRYLLYTKKIEAENEYRIHVVDGKVIAAHRKVATVDNADPSIKNTANGWKFRWVDIYPKDVANQAILAVEAIGLDFAAVDVIWDGKLAYVLETNTAPGIDGMEWTLGEYARSLKLLIERKKKELQICKIFDLP